ncbi:MAG: peptide deformylase [Ruminococcus sp.]|nr:peptide deformylase [Ruminococcus sp.]
MERQIVKDVLFLGRKSTLADKNDTDVITDLKDTLAANADRCVGMAANMIGKSKRIIIFDEGEGQTVMINPVITKRSGKYETEEGCLSLVGVRKTVRYKAIEVRYLDEDFKPKKGSFSGFTAQIIQHECDHLEGKII